jgi:hypothetical protein
MIVAIMVVAAEKGTDFASKLSDPMGIATNIITVRRT